MNDLIKSDPPSGPLFSITKVNNTVKIPLSAESESSSKDSEDSSPISTSLPQSNSSNDNSIQNDDLQAEQQRKARLAGPSSKKVKFTKAEDIRLMMLVQEFSTKDWKTIAEHMFPRTARQCRERWTNYVNPTLSKDPWSKEEDLLLIEKHNEFGNRWKLIERYFPGRSKNNIKHRWSVMKDLHIAIDAPSKRLDANTPVASNGFIDFPLRSSRSTHSPVSLQTLQLMRAVTQQQKMNSELPNNDNNNSLLALKQAFAAAHAAAQRQAQINENPIQPTNDFEAFENNIQIQNSNSATILPSIHNFTSNVTVPAPLLSGAVISSPMPIPSISSVLISPTVSSPTYALKLKPQLGEPSDHLKYFDRILDPHEVNVTPEIDKPDMWTFPEESYF